tara:strand:- start:8 stop:379 length:372 start_codon:yes stop_codon:yes gene_type:complete
MAKKKITKPKKKEDNSIPTLVHILGLFTGFLGPLIVFFASKEKRDKNHAKYCLNWQFSFMIYTAIVLIITIPLIFILVGIILLPILMMILIILNYVFGIIAAVKASRGELWKYPLAIPFFKAK